MNTLSSQFEFEFVFHGHYTVTYRTPHRGDYWRALLTDMTLIDATHNEENPTTAAWKRLRKVVKTKGTHYSKGGRIMDEESSTVYARNLTNWR